MTYQQRAKGKYYELPRVPWVTAGVMNFWPAASFEAFGIPAGTVRRWAHEGNITAVAIGPNGCLLYRTEHVVAYRAKMLSKKPDGTTPVSSLQCGPKS